MTDAEKIVDLQRQNLQLQAEILTIKIAYNAMVNGASAELLPYLQQHLQSVKDALKAPNA